MNIFQILSLVVLFAAPGTTNYKLNSFGFGSGGTAGSSTATYRMEGIVGDIISGNRISTATYKLKPEFIQTQQANVPPAPSISNPANYYDKLRIIINTGGNPSDALFAVSISSDNFSSDIRYVKADNSVGSSLAVADYRTYASWGSGTGINIIGLNASTTYTVRVKATQGRFTESEYGPTAQAATVGEQLSFGLSTNTIALGNLLPATVTTSSSVTASIDTNANAGGNIYISGQNGGLQSSSASSSIATATADLSIASTGFGVQSVSSTQSSGGPLNRVSPYNGSGQNVGLTDTVLREIFHATAPVTGGQGVFTVKAKASSTTPAGADYVETLRVVGAAIF